MSKVDQYYRWSTIDLINFLILTVWYICQKINYSILNLYGKW